MAWLRPTLTALKQQIINDIQAQLPSGSVLSRFNILRILGTALAGLSYHQHGHIDNAAQQAVPFTATGTALVAWANFRGLSRNYSSAAVGTCSAKNGTIGSVLPIGTLFNLGDGTQYSTTAAATVDGAGNISAPIIATAFGVDGNQEFGVALSLASPIVGIPTSFTASAITGGADDESDNSLRSRMLAAFAAPAQAGNTTDYGAWALAADVGVTRAWTVLSGTGQVTVYVMFDGTYGFPTGTMGTAALESRGAGAATGDLLLVANYVYPLRPVTALVYLSAPIPFPINISIQGLGSTSSTYSAAISAAISNMLLVSGDPLRTSLYQSQFEEAIASVPGIGNFNLLSPNATITPALGYLPTLGTVNFS